MIDYMYRLMHDVCNPAAPALTPSYNLLTPRLASFLLHSKVGASVSNHLSMAMTLLTPASAILSSHAGRKGSIEPGKDADLAVFDVKDYREIAYWFGANHCATSVLNGVVAERQ